MPPPPCMASPSWPALVLVVLVLNTGVATGVQANTSTEEGALLDVRVFSLECLENGSCEPTQPPHLIEYFSADWCEPCVQVGEQLSNVSSDEAVVLQHHSSPQDATYLPGSKLKYDRDFRLLFYPSIVVDGKHLLTGSRQALDLSNVMENETPTWSGLESLRLENSTLVWNASNTGIVSVWMLAPTAHQTSGKIHPSVAYEHVAVNATEGSLALDEKQIRKNSSFVVLLEQPGRRNLTVASLAPTGLVDVSDGQEVATTPISTMFDRDFALVVGMVLVLSLAPAFVIHRELMTGSREQKVSMNDEEE